MIETSHLLKVIDVYRSATGLADSSISNYIFNDGKKIQRLRDGREITVRRFNFALRWFSSHWPEDVSWPDGVPRPLIEGKGGVGSGVDEALREGAEFLALKKRQERPEVSEKEEELL